MARTDWEGLGDESPTIRSERLRVLLKLQSAEPLDVYPGDSGGDLTGWEQGVFLTVNDEDQALAWECLQIERERRQAQWNALELLDHAVNGPAPAATGKGDGDKDFPSVSDLVLVRRDQLAAAMSHVLGWHRPPPEG